MTLMTNRQKEELADYCMNLSKLSLGSWVFGLFASDLTLEARIILMIAGLTFAVIFFILGMRLFKEVK